MKQFVFDRLVDPDNLCNGPMAGSGAAASDSRTAGVAGVNRAAEVLLGMLAR